MVFLASFKSSKYLENLVCAVCVLEALLFLAGPKH